MAEVVLHFTNRDGKRATATVQTPVVLRFATATGRKRVVVGEDAGVRAILLNGDPPPGPGVRFGEIPPNLEMVPDDAGPGVFGGGGPGGAVAIDPTRGEEIIAASSPPPPPPGGGPGVCYDVGRETFCW